MFAAGDGTAARLEAAVAVASAFPRLAKGEACPYIEEATRTICESGLFLAPSETRTRACTISELMKDDSFQAAYTRCQRLSGEERVRAASKLMAHYCGAVERTVFEAVLFDGALVHDETPSRSLVEAPSIDLQKRLLACTFEARPAHAERADGESPLVGVEVVWTPPPRAVAGPDGVIRFDEDLKREVITIESDDKGCVTVSATGGEDAMVALEHAFSCALPAPPQERTSRAQGGILGESVRSVLCEMIPIERLGEAIGEEAASRAELIGAQRVAVTRDMDRASLGGPAAVIEAIGLAQNQRSAEVFTASVVYEDMPGVRDTQYAVACIRARLASTGAACLQAGPEASPRLREAIIREGGLAAQGGGVMIIL